MSALKMAKVSKVTHRRVWDAESLVSAITATTNEENVIIDLEENDYELSQVMSLEGGGGRLLVRGPRLVECVWPSKLLRYGWRAGFVSAFAWSAMQQSCDRQGWQRFLGAYAFVELGEVFYRRWRRRSKQLGCKSARIVAKDGVFAVQGCRQVTFERLSIASNGSRSTVRACGKSSVHCIQCDMACRGGNGLECMDNAELKLDNTTVANCQRSGAVLMGDGDCKLLVSGDCTFANNKRFGVELCGGAEAIIEDSQFEHCGICVSDRGLWQSKGMGVTIRKCLLQGRAVCLPGISVIGDSVPQSILLDSCSIRDVNGAGIYSLGNHSLKMCDCIISNAAMAGIEALRGSRLHVKGSHIIGNHGGGIVLHRDAEGTFSKCSIDKNQGGGGCGILAGASCVLSHCSISESRAVGLHVCRGSATLHRCTILNNGDAGLCLGGRDSRSGDDHNHIRGRRRRQGYLHGRPTQTAPSEQCVNREGRGDSSRLILSDCLIRGLGKGALLVVPHTLNQSKRHQDEKNADHHLIAQDSVFYDTQTALRFDACTDGLLAGNNFIGPVSVVNWFGATKISWNIERLLHLGARGPHGDATMCLVSPLRHLNDPALIRLIAQFAAG